jgi:hypothetical protein
MGYSDAFMATASGVAAFALSFGAAVAAIATVLPNPQQIGMPFALGIGMAAMTGTYIGLAQPPGTLEFRIAFASGAFGVTFLGVFVAGFAAGGGLSIALASGGGAGVLAAGGVLLVTR